jgi:two-component system LytT family response regulator
MHVVQESTVVAELASIMPPSPVAEHRKPEPLAPRKVKKIRALIADDQPLAREMLRRLLLNEPDIEIIAMPGNGREAVQAIIELEPDLVFLDVQMPELDGFGVVAQIGPDKMPAVIFVTGEKEFALKAFDVQAIDYLLKPCARDRFQIALGRARSQIRGHDAIEANENCNTLLDDIRIEAGNPDRIAVKSDGRILFLRLADLDWIEAAENDVKLHAGAEEHLLRESMAALEARLPSDRFLRISRSAIVNIDQIRELQPLFHGEYTVVLRNNIRLTLTRGYREKLRQLGLA